MKVRVFMTGNTTKGKLELLMVIAPTRVMTGRCLLLVSGRAILSDVPIYFCLTIKEGDSNKQGVRDHIVNIQAELSKKDESLKIYFQPRIKN